MLAVRRVPARPRALPPVDLALIIQECGPRALPIVTLISFLVGMILAFVGAVQLQQFGAEIYVADLVGIAMVREMGAMMTAIIMAGRTGAAFAAQLGTMKVNEEIDALVDDGHLADRVPRAAAHARRWSLMMPLLRLYADLLGILGGAVVGVGMLDIPPRQYFDETLRRRSRSATSPGGVVKASVFGVLVAIAGCLRGMQCGPQRLGGRARRDLGGRHRHRAHHRRRRDLRRHLQCPRAVMARRDARGADDAAAAPRIEVARPRRWPTATS